MLLPRFLWLRQSLRPWHPHGGRNENGRPEGLPEYRAVQIAYVALQVAVVLFREIFQRFLDVHFVVGLIELAIRLAPELFALLVVVGEGIYASTAIGPPVFLPVSIFVFVVPWTVFGHMTWFSHRIIAMLRNCHAKYRLLGEGSSTGGFALKWLGLLDLRLAPSDVRYPPGFA